ncbi:MAG: hypothetical protein Q4A00_03575 [Flavobacteriaceae bacterium]|nr:hypothetical protein [Flavobacteriaceae bacterium]
MNKPKSKLYRKVNTKTYNVAHNFGGDFRDSHHQKPNSSPTMQGKMPKKTEGIRLYATLSLSSVQGWQELG